MYPNGYQVASCLVSLSGGNKMLGPGFYHSYHHVTKLWQNCGINCSTKIINEDYIYIQGWKLGRELRAHSTETWWPTGHWFSCRLFC